LQKGGDAAATSIAVWETGKGICFSQSAGLPVGLFLGQIYNFWPFFNFFGFFIFEKRPKKIWLFLAK